MKKTLLGLVISIVTFTISVLAYNFLSFQPETILPVAFESERVVEIKKTEPNSTTFDLPKPNEIESDYSPSPDGAYFPVNEKGLEKDLALTLGFYENKASAEVIVGRKFYQTTVLIFNDKIVSFKTKKAKGIEYFFKGKFLKNPFKNWVEDGEILLEGTLQKSINGKMVYKTSKRFVFDSEVCAWKDIEFEQAN